MYGAVSSAGIGLFFSTCFVSLSNANPGPTCNLSLINELPVLRRAFSVISPSGAENLDAVHGAVCLEETTEGIFITGSIYGLKPGRHGFHVHQEGTLENNCKASGGHYNPAGVSSLIF